LGRKIIHHSFLWQMRYGGSRGQGKFLAKSGEVRSSEVGGVLLDRKGAH